MKSWLSSEKRVATYREAPEMKYVFIENIRLSSASLSCRVLRVRSGWYTWCQRRTSDKHRVSSSANTATALSLRGLYPVKNSVTVPHA